MVLQDQNSPSRLRILRPYLIITVVGILAFAPVSFMIYALKNDIIVLEYPINYYMSQCIHNWEIPYWFNTWGMGFPLQSNLTWGIFSTSQLVFCTIFNYNIYALHIEFIFFILLSGWSMFHLLKKYFLKDENIALLLSICYMLSGFMVGSSQWLLYITAAAFVPLVISSILKLFGKPSFSNSLQCAVIYSMMFTSVYAAFNIITTYSLVVFLILYFPLVKSENKRRTMLYVGLAGLITLILCLPCLYYTLELLKYLDRGNSIVANTSFFNSNYLHPAALSTMLLPFSSVKMNFSNTEGTMLNSYLGLFALLIFPFAIYKSFKEKNKYALFILAAAVIFLVISFGGITPLRNVLNILPGFSYFRNPAIFRFYFLISVVLLIAMVFRNNSLKELFDSKFIRITAWILLIVCLTALFSNIKKFGSLPDSIIAFVKNIDLSQTIFISSFIQALLLILFLLLRSKHQKLLKIILIADLIFNTFICTPFFSASSYSLKEVNTILHSAQGFPIQNKNVNEVATVFKDEKMNNWYNINVYAKEVSSNKSNRGPLTLKSFSRFGNDSVQLNKPFVYGDCTNVSIKLQRPSHVQVTIESNESCQLTLMQNSFPGWKAYYNNKPAEFIEKEKPGLTIAVPGGNGTIDFKYERKGIWLYALLLHLITISFLIYCGAKFVKRNFIRSSSLS